MGEYTAAVARLDDHDGVFLDLDGTVYTGSDPVPGAAETALGLRTSGVALRYVTNNAAKTADEVAERLRAMGFKAQPDEVHTSSDAGCSMLRERLPSGARVLVLGTDSLAAAVAAVGMDPVREAAGVVDAVVQGHNPETGWRDLSEACLAIRGGALWVACNGDATLPSERGELPGNGSMVAALHTATGAEPVVAGKPHPPLLTLAAQQSGCSKPLVVGDRLETDIAGAYAAEMDALLVLSGVTNAAKLLEAREGERPRYVAADLNCLSRPLAEVEVPAGESARGQWRVVLDGTALSVSGTGGGSVVALLRELCACAWDTGTSAVRPGDSDARTALIELGLPLAAWSSGIR